MFYHILFNIIFLIYLYFHFIAIKDNCESSPDDDSDDEDNFVPSTTTPDQVNI